LKQTAEKSQIGIKRFLESHNIRFVELWIQNTIAAYDVKLELIQKLDSFKDVANIWLNGIVQPEIEEPLDETLVDTSVEDTTEWFIEHVKAPAVWKAGHTGKGVVLATSDTGVHYTHEALVTNYRGNLGNGKFDHNYNWYDPAMNRTEPSDSNGHGTHVTGTAAGGNKGRKVGMAPSAKWISCRPFSSSGRPADFVKCLQFFLAPTKMDGSAPNPDLRPHVSSHSYFCNNCNMHRSIQALRAAGSVFVKSCGNRGPSCRSITEPGFYKEALCAGALAQKSDEIASFSSRGPTPDGLIKPDFSTPGQNVNSAFPGASNNVYRTMSGTSMAAPNLNGAIGLLWSAVPKLSRKIDETIEILKKTSKRQTSTLCTTTGSPNNVFGYGTINIFAAYELAKSIYGTN
jgi:subtilisin family serine protease